MIILEGLRYNLIFKEQNLEGVYIVLPELHKDSRGYLFESYKKSEFEKKLNVNFVQQNQVYSKHAFTLRGMHYQINNSQGKLVYVIEGSIKDVVVDIRKGSKNFGKSFSIELNSRNHKMLYVSPGFAHGYMVLKDHTIVQYKCTDYYDPKSENGIIWNDPEIKIDWGVSNPILSEKDRNLPLLKNQKMLPLL